MISLQGIILVSLVTVVVSEQCYHCLYVQDQQDDETLMTMTRKTFADLGMSSQQVEEQLQQAMTAYLGMGFDLNLPFRTACFDPRSSANVPEKNSSTNTSTARSPGVELTTPSNVTWASTFLGNTTSNGLHTCQSKGACGKIFSSANSLTTVWRGCPLSCTVGSQNSIDITCCQGNLCNLANVAMVGRLLLASCVAWAGLMNWRRL